MPKGQSLQNRFLEVLQKEKMAVAIYLVNGIKLQGVIKSFDQYVLVLEGAVGQLVYKHAISTIVPAKPVDLPSSNDDGYYSDAEACAE